MTDRWTDRLSEYIDDELAAPERAALEEHLAGCDDCRATVADLRAVVARAAALEPAEPETDLWEGIRHRIAADVRVLPFTVPARSGRGRVAFSLPQLAAAAVLIAFVSGGAVWLAVRGTGDEAVPAFAVDPLPAESAAVQFAASREYESAIDQLERELERARANLDPATIAVVERNLAAIDAAIAEARGALAADPANPYLNRHLDNTLMTKIEVLRRVTRVGRGQT